VELGNTLRNISTYLVGAILYGCPFLPLWLPFFVFHQNEKRYSDFFKNRISKSKLEKANFARGSIIIF
jgi:hypothetical protein